MNAEIISVGTELLLGQTINTDAAFVAQELSAIGINLLYTTVVGDNPERLTDTLLRAYDRTDLIITTGGLGPTADDLTKEIIASSAGKKLVLDEEAKKEIEEYFAFRDRTLTENQLKQAYLPEGAFKFKNTKGTAPGCAFKTENGKLVIMLPGPPSELIPMMQLSAVPYLLNLENSIIHSVNIHVFGRGEGEVAALIDDYVNLSNPTVATYAKDGEMFVRVTAKASSLEEAQKLCAPIVKEIEDIIGEFVYTDVYSSLEELVVNLLKENGKTISTAESCTGGLLGKRITDISGASSVFGTGVITYANSAKEKLLNVSHESLEAYGAVSEQVAKQMAENVRLLGESDLGIGITGVAGPAHSEAKPVGLIYIALSDGNKTIVHKLSPSPKSYGRDRLRNKSASYALDMVRRYFEGTLK